MSLFPLPILQNRNKKLLFYSIIVILFLVASRNIATNAFAPDSYLHLAIGEYIWKQRAIPAHTDLSFKEVEPILELRAHSWLIDLLGFFLFQLNSLTIPVFLCGSLAASCVLLQVIFSKLRIANWLRILALCICLVLVGIFWKFHPLILATPILLGMVYELLFMEKWTKNAIFPLSILMLLFANIAGGYIFLPLIICAVYAFWNEMIELATKLINGRKTKIHLRTIDWIWPLAVLSCGFISPLGIKNLQYVQTLMFVFDERKWFSTLAGTLSATNANYAKLTPSTLPFALFLIYALVTIILYFFGFIRYKKAFFLRAAKTFPLLFLFYFGLRWYRAIPLVTFTTMPAFVLGLSTLQSLWKWKSWKFKYVETGFTGFVFLGALCLLIFPAKTLSFVPPEAQVKFMKDEHIIPNYLPSIELGGYTYFSFFPLRGHLDAQDDLFDEHDILSLYGTSTAVPPDFLRNISETYEINAVLSSKETEYLNLTVGSDPEWLLVYLDYNGFIFVKKENYPVEFISKHGLSHLDFTRNLGFDPEDIDEGIKELEMFTTEYPTTLALGQLASMYRFKKNPEMGLSTLQKIPKKNWDFIVWTEYGRLQAATGNCLEAEKGFLQALDQRNEKNLSRTVLDLAVLYAGCLGDKQKALHYFQRYNSFPLPPPEREKARQLGKQFGINLDEDADKAEGTQ